MLLSACCPTDTRSDATKPTPMRFLDTGSGFSLCLSAHETYQWARRPGAAWPCSFLAGRRLRVEFDRGGLVDLVIDGGRGDQDAPDDELSAIVADHVARKLSAEHPCHFVAVGQFQDVRP